MMNEDLVARLCGMTAVKVADAAGRLEKFKASLEFTDLPFVQRHAVQRAAISLDYLASALRMCAGGRNETLYECHGKAQQINAAKTHGNGTLRQFDEQNE